MQPVGVTLAGDGDDGCPVHVGIRHPCDQIGGTRSEGRKADIGPSSKTAVDVGHERRSMFVTHGDKTDIAVKQRVHHIQALLTWDTEDVFHTFVLQAAYK